MKPQMYCEEFTMYLIFQITINILGRLKYVQKQFTYVKKIEK